MHLIKCCLCKSSLFSSHAWHDDVITWKQFLRYWPFLRGIHWSPVNFPHKGQWCRSLMSSFISAGINCWVNNHEAGDLWGNHAHYDVTIMETTYSLHWHHNEWDGISNLQHLDCLLNCLFRSRSKWTSKLCFTGLCEGNSLVISEFPTQRVSNTENVSIWQRHHVEGLFITLSFFFSKLHTHKNAVLHLWGQGQGMVCLL